MAVAAQPCDRPTRDLGTGVVVAEDVIATAAHVVDGPRRAVTVDGEPAAVIAVDPRTDLALLRADVPGSGGRRPTAEVEPGDEATVRTPDGDLAVEIVRTGQLVVDDTTAGVRHEREVVTFRPAVGGGTSGAPLIDDDGRLAGIVVLANRTDDTSYAVSAGELAALVASDSVAPPPAGCPG